MKITRTERIIVTAFIIALLAICVFAGSRCNAQSLPVPTATVASESEINLIWTPQSSPITIQRSADGGNTWGTIYTAPAYGAIWTDTALYPTTTYEYRLQDLKGDLSTVSSATTLAVPAAGAATPTGLTVTATSPTTATVSFADTDASVQSRDYMIERSPDGGLTYQVIGTTGENVSGPYAYPDTLLTSGAIYTYRVRCTPWSEPESAYTLPVSVTMPPLPAGTPNAPTGMVVVNNSATTNTITWTDTNAGTASYSVERALWSYGAFSWAVVGTVGPGVTSFMDTGCVAEQSYSYRVRAFK